MGQVCRISLSQGNRQYRCDFGMDAVTCNHSPCDLRQGVNDGREQAAKICRTGGSVFYDDQTARTVSSIVRSDLKPPPPSRQTLKQPQNRPRKLARIKKARLTAEYRLYHHQRSQRLTSRMDAKYPHHPSGQFVIAAVPWRCCRHSRQTSL